MWLRRTETERSDERVSLSLSLSLSHSLFRTSPYSLSLPRCRFSLIHWYRSPIESIEQSMEFSFLILEKKIAANFFIVRDCHAPVPLNQQRELQRRRVLHDCHVTANVRLMWLPLGWALGSWGPRDHGDHYMPRWILLLIHPFFTWSVNINSSGFIIYT